MASKKTSAKTAKKSAPAAGGDGLIDPGKPAPAFKLNDQAGRSHTLKDYRGRWVVLYFYPKDNTSGCTTEACQFRDGFGQFKRRKAAVLGVSPDGQASHQKFIAKLGLPFDLLADPGSKMCTAYGVWRQKSMYGRTYMGVVRTTYLIDPRGRVAYRWDKVKVPGHDADVLAKLAELAGGQPA